MEAEHVIILKANDNGWVSKDKWGCYRVYSKMDDDFKLQYIGHNRETALGSYNTHCILV